MINALKQILQFPETSSASEPLSKEDINLACAALLVEVAVIDGHFDDVELNSLKSSLYDSFSVNASQMNELIETAKIEQKSASSVYQFTRIVNDHCPYEDKFQLVKAMWQVAYADCDLDKYEEYIVRKVSDLLHLDHADFIRAKIEARPPV